MRKTFFIILMLMWYLLPANTTFAYSRQDSLRGSNGNGRSWWDVSDYYLYISFDTANQSIAGMNIITYTVIDDIGRDSMQIDLQQPMILDSAVADRKKINIVREGNVYWLTGMKQLNQDRLRKVILYYHGTPRKAKLPPWDGGLIWQKDSEGHPWLAVACQGLGASSWWPCKDYQADEPDNGMNINLYTPYKWITISNGKFVARNENKDSTASLWTWRVRNPINTYNTTYYIGNYIGWPDTLMGENGKLDLGFFALKHNEEKAHKQFAVTKSMLHCFEYWMGPYPFYEDGYKLIEAPYLGMEHQSAIAYGNGYQMGYKGSDRSGTGVGMLFDFIIVHESGHEWFGNNITAADVADNWIHEGFTTYTEVLFAEWSQNKEAAYKYARGLWKNILNDRPVVGDYGVHDEGSPDKYDKGAAVVHMVRVMMDNDSSFRQLLRGLNKDYYHSIVTSQQLEQYIIDKTGLPLEHFFDQYLRNTEVPEIEWYIKKKKLYYRFTNTIDGFTLPLEVKSGKLIAKIKPTKEWQSISWKKGGYNVRFSEDFLVKMKI